MPSIQYLQEAASQKLSNGEPLEKYLQVLDISVDSEEWEEMVAKEILHQSLFVFGGSPTPASVGKVLARDLETVIRTFVGVLKSPASHAKLRS
jgi:hypothetical protein